MSFLRSSPCTNCPGREAITDPLTRNVRIARPNIEVITACGAIEQVRLGKGGGQEIIVRKVRTNIDVITHGWDRGRGYFRRVCDPLSYLCVGCEQATTWEGGESREIIRDEAGEDSKGGANESVVQDQIGGSVTTVRHYPWMAHELRAVPGERQGPTTVVRLYHC
jgi:hypothetical protein